MGGAEAEWVIYKGLDLSIAADSIRHSLPSPHLPSLPPSPQV